MALKAARMQVHSTAMGAKRANASKQPHAMVAPQAVETMSAKAVQKREAAERWTPKDRAAAHATMQ